MIDNKMRTKIYFILSVVFVVFFLAFWIYIEQLGQKHDLQTYRAGLDQESTLFNNSVKHETVISDLLVKNPIIVNTMSRRFQKRGATASADFIVSKTLRLAAELEGFSAVYLLDSDGTCVYSSRRDFIGQNYSFRPYYSNALRSGTAYYAAVGVTSKQLGLYYGQVVRTELDIVGVLVIKFLPDFDFLHAFYGKTTDAVPDVGDHTAGILTESGVIVDLTNSEMFSLEDLSEKQLQALKSGRQFDPARIQSFHFPPGTLAKLKEQGFLELENEMGTPYLLFFTSASDQGFPLVHIISRTWFYENYNQFASSYRFFVLFMFVLVCLLCLLLFILGVRYRQFMAMAATLAKESRSRLEEQRKFKSILNESSEGFWLCGHENGKILMVNPSLCKLLGYEENEIIGQVGREFMPSNEGSFSKELFHAQKKKIGFESKILRKNGEERDVLIHASCFTDKETGQEYRFAFFADITELKNQRRRLDLFGKIVEQMSSSLVITDIRGNILYTNPFFSQITGYSREEARGENPRILQSGETDPAVYKKLWATILKGETWKGMLKNRKKDGSFYWEGASIFPVFDEQGKISHLVAIKNDITERILLEREVASQAKQHELIIQHAEIGLSLIKNHKIVWGSRAGAKMFGYSDHELVRGLSTDTIFKDYETFVDVTSRALDCFRRDEVFSEELLMRRADGTLFWCRITGTIIDSSDLSLGAIWLTEDISKQREQQQLLVDARDQAWEASRAKSSFLANMSHEIRTPMNAIIGMSRLLRDTDLDVHQQYYVETVLNSSKYLLGLINDILDFSKIESGRLELNNKPFSVSGCVASVLRDSSVLTMEKGLVLEHDISPEVPDYVIGDEMRLRQVLLNLISNGIKFTEKGSVDVLVRRCEEDVSSLCLQFQVLDTGIGIDPEKKEEIFQEFIQADTSIASRFGGTGLGLTISSQLCKLMGGELRVDSIPDVGSCFTATVRFEPLSTTEYAELDATTVIDEVTLPALDILVVDDNESNRFLARHLFKRDDHRVLEASSGLEALNILSCHGFDVVLMDVRMPYLDGLETTRIIRACEQGKEADNAGSLDKNLLDRLRERLEGGYVPIIALTANALDEDRKQCLEAGMDEYASKPFTASEIYQAIWSVLSRGKKNSGCSSKNPVVPENSVAGTKTVSAANDRFGIIQQHLQKIYGLEAGEVAEMCRLSADSLADAARKAEQALDGGDMEGLSAAAHKAKGGLSALGLDRETEIARRLEAAAKKPHKQDFGAMVRELVVCIEEVITSFKLEEGDK
jgi:PAS domain S-box-containing protein